MKDGKHQTLQEVSSQVETYFRSLSYNKQRISFYQKGWSVIEQFMVENSIDFYEAKVGDAFISKIQGTSDYSELSRREKDLIRCANVLTEYQNTGSIKFRSILKKYPLKGEIGEGIQGYLSYRKSQGASDDTVNNNKLYLHRLLEFLESNQVTNFSELDNQHILEFINGLGYYSKSTIHCMLSSLRGFLKYLFENGISEYNLTYLVPKSSYKKEARLPTTYTKDEINHLLASVDRGNPKGKRDIVMVLLAARLGLRASDICGLKFENIHWETNTIHLVQKKTKEKIELPLLTEIGNAIIDYLKFGRPKSDLPYLFLRTGQPYDKLEEPTLHNIVSFYLKQAGIKNIENKKHGPHALRHSLAGILLEKKTPLPVISEVLGHTNTESTKTYLRIDLDTLRQCSLDVLPLNTPLFEGVK
ncbi:tyrosine-type recombinase/integrase [Siminovitchia sediminis]|uniref:Tyrosine-type recombinase/integrase n=1 Tax=Siminovitchia sediminis TaxID=1274353 RepID=A0ABW4KIH6_9BACI